MSFNPLQLPQQAPSTVDLPKRARKVLAPFVAKPWRSALYGELQICGDPASQVLEVLAEESGFTRTLTLDAEGIQLSDGRRLCGRASDGKTKAVWSLGGTQVEVWTTWSTEPSSSSTAPPPPPIVEEPAKLTLEEAMKRLELDPTSAKAKSALGDAKMAEGDWRGACTAYAEALDLEPGNVASWQGLTEALKSSLAPHVLQGCRATYDLRGNDAKEIWRSFMPKGAPSSKQLAARQFALSFGSEQAKLPFLLTMPAETGQEKYPLALYLHSAGASDICSGDYQLRQLQYLTQESPAAVLVEKGEAGAWDNFIGAAPCCPSNLGQLSHAVPRHLRKKKVYWFKSVDAGAYQEWDFSDALRCRDVERLVAEFLLHLCQVLPVDMSRIYFVGMSAGGYAVIRLAELLPGVPAAVVAMAGYYPEIPEQDHNPEVMAYRLRQVTLWLMHCRSDKLCRLDSRHVSRMYELLAREVDWVPEKMAKGSSSNYHSAQQKVFASPDLFFRHLAQFRRQLEDDVIMYLQTKLREMTGGGRDAFPQESSVRRWGNGIEHC